MTRHPLAVLAGMLFVALVGGCREAPALEVGPVAYSHSELLGLSEQQRLELAWITTVALAVADDDLDRLGEGFRSGRSEDRLIERLREELALEWAGVDDEVLRARYGSRPEYELEVRHLVRLSERWRSSEHRERARAEAEGALERIRAGEAFGEVAGETSEEPGARERGGLLEPGRDGTWVREFWAAASSLDPGEVSGVVETQYGFHVLQLEARREIPFAEARDRVASEVAAQVDDRARWEEWIADRSGEDGEVRSVLLHEAEARSIALTREDLVRLEREWERTIGPIVAAFGFERGMRNTEVKEAAFAALGATGQNARIARDELRALGPLIASMYPVRLGEG